MLKRVKRKKEIIKLHLSNVGKVNSASDFNENLVKELSKVKRNYILIVLNNYFLTSNK